jgi:beta-glucosidase
VPLPRPLTLPGWPAALLPLGFLAMQSRVGVGLGAAMQLLILQQVDGAQAWGSRSDPPSVRAKLLLQRMHLEEKVSMLHGVVVPGWGTECFNKTTGTIPHPSCAYTGNVAGNPRLGIPPLHLNDGPQGFRENTHPGTTTQFPSGLTVAASWDVASMEAWGRAMGREFFAKGSNVQLGPGVCLARVPNDGRNFEYLSGEDPYLGFVLAQRAVTGIQSQGVIANAKHYVNNNQETNRNTVLEIVDERTRYEMYLPPFEGAVQANVGSVMCSYNKVQPGPLSSSGAWSCENPVTLKTDLKERLNFSGWVMSDW